MELNAIRVLEVLRNKGVKHLHHANTVRTSCTFLQQGRLLARGVVEDRGLLQTPQKSDLKDKKYGVWCDVFLDGVDIHERARSHCDYGPVLFMFDLKVLEQDALPSVWVTKSNPVYWRAGQSQSDRYFESIDELDESYQYGDFGKSIVLRSAAGILRLKPFLKKILLDNPSRTDSMNVDLFGQAIGALRASTQAGLRVTMGPRVCRSGCGCQSEYKDMEEPTLKNFFIP